MRITKLFKILFLTFFLYVPYVKLGSQNIFFGYFSFFIPWFLLIKNFKIFLPKYIINIIYLLLFSFLYILITTLMNVLISTLPIPDLRGIKLHISMFFIVLSTYAVHKFFLKEYADKAFLEIIYYASFVNIFFIILCYIFPFFSDFFYSIIAVSPKLFTYAITRYPGFLYDGASYISVYNGIIFILGLIIFYEYKHHFVEKTFLIISQCLTFASIIFLGRTGIVVVIIGCIFIMIYFIITKKYIKISFYKKSFILLFSIVLCIYFGVILLIELNYYWYLEWAFTFLKNIINNQPHIDSSVTEIQNNHYFLPDSLWGTLFGLSDYQTTRSATYTADPGYTIYLHGSGILGLIFYITIMFYFIYVSTKKKYFSDKKTISFFIIFLVVVLLIVNTKDFYIFYPYPHYLLLILLYCQLKKR